LAKLLLDPPNFLVMDEPTTHLDMRSIEALISALSQYEGTLVFVSHDVHFIRLIATSVLHVQPGQIRFYPGSYDYFVEKTASDSNNVSNVSSEAPPRSESSTRSQEKERKRLEAEARQQRSQKERGLRAKLQQIEKRILELEERQQQLVVALQESNGSTSEESLELKQITDELSGLMPEWERLVEEVNAVKAVVEG
jgi:ATP-binding cassette, subfamily F, member 3